MERIEESPIRDKWPMGVYEFLSIFEYPWGISRDVRYISGSESSRSDRRVKYRVLYQDLIKIARKEIREGC